MNTIKSIISYFSQTSEPTEKTHLLVKKIVDEKKCMIKTCPGNKWNKNGEEQKYCYTHSQKLLNFDEEKEEKEEKEN